MYKLLFINCFVFPLTISEQSITSRLIKEEDTIKVELIVIGIPKPMIATSYQYHLLPRHANA